LCVPTGEGVQATGQAGADAIRTRGGRGTVSQAAQTTTSLRDPCAHRTIHAAAADLEAAMATLRRAVVSRDDHAPDAAQLVLDLWRERVLTHAEAEEQDLYPALLAPSPARDSAMRLLRDHDLLRAWHGEAASALERAGRPDRTVLSRLEAMLV
jgi:cobalamin biosynthesis protein CobT